MARTLSRHPLGALLLGGLVVRVALALLTDAFGYDLRFYENWGTWLVDGPPWAFYVDHPEVDHLPGDLWLVWLIAHVHELLVGGQLYFSSKYELLVQLVPILADLGVGAGVYAIARRLRGDRAALVAGALFLLNPGAIYVSAVWGQWDAVSAALAVLGLVLVLDGRLRLALPALAAAATIKPQMGIVALLAVVHLARTGSLRRLVVPLALGAATVVAITAPFNAAPRPIPTRFDLLDRIDYAVSLYELASHGAFNLWALTAKLTGPNLVVDSRPHVLGLDYRTWGTVLFALALAFVVTRVWRARTQTALVWGSFAATLALFVLLTRVHERYLLPALAIGAAVAAVDRRLRLPYAGLSLVLLVDVVFLYEQQQDFVSLPGMNAEAVHMGLGAISVGVLAYALTAASPPVTPLLARARTFATRRWVTVGLLACAATAMVVLLLEAGRGTTFYASDWDFVLERRGRNLATLFEPQGEHLVLVPLLLFKAVILGPGLDDYGLLRGAMIAVNLACGVLVFLYARRRVGGLPAVALAAAIMLMGPAWADLVWPGRIGPLIAVAAGVGALLALDRRDRRGDGIACGLLCLAVASSTVGALVAGAVVLELVAGRAVRRLWVAGVPVALYALWFAAYGDAGPGDAGGVLDFTTGTADDAAGALSGLGPAYGRTIAVLIAAGVLWTLATRAEGRPRLLALAALPPGLWAALGTFGDPAAAGGSVHLHAAAVFLGLAAVEALRDRRIGAAEATLAVAVLTVGVVENARHLVPYSQTLRDRGAATAGSLAGTELIGPDPALVPVFDRRDLTGAAYLESVHRYGSSAGASPRDLPTAPEPVRHAADGVFVAHYRPTLTPVDADTPASVRPAVARQDGGRVTEEDRCVRFVPLRRGARVEVVVPPEGIRVAALATLPVEVRIRRFAGRFPQGALELVGHGRPGLLVLPADGVSIPWHASLLSRGPVRVCGGPPVR